MTTEYEECVQKKKTSLSETSTDTMIIEVLSRVPFITQSEIAETLELIGSERLESIAKENPLLMHTVYDILLLRAGQNERETREINSTIYTDFNTPCTPYNKWSQDILKFTTLDLKSAQKISALLKRKYADLKPYDITELLRKLEYMCTGTSFSPQEKSLSLALLNIAVKVGSLPPAEILNICSIMKCMQYESAESTLLEYFERTDLVINEDAVSRFVQMKKVQSHWMVRVLLQVHPDRVMNIFYKIEESLHHFIKEKDIERVVAHLTPLYMHSQTEEIEESIFSRFKERDMLKSMCNEHIWS
ncbi:hypothetical protein NEAUS04_0235 [Nematocida ausubeli]|uniref:Uncharacterized protein n=1 Tax=Nematocida ausubeli (strain ATCC PRA-371 / ERTm2) TaxID=1913371 RepID=A0A086J0K8_NEMA1|nr:uncharacterized protein NESG_01655 [Nematocida ausubeli]KAI5134023.1 hypothetical protein NEAUS07_0676 [Nematocida ausubeli]KAI5147414.1 hypothetical protein NEAUS05_0721 [Nematocida ausubeli]KAI5160966.1 hypothetical protein NEAUS04_0235 [Nematocida ausubeli]KFG25676.1 hypothetical protein NESG_01655 [Nematocida ausubeli]